MKKILSKDLPKEALEALRAITKGPPYPFLKDGTEFKNYEKRLPIKEPNYYQELTVETPNITSRRTKKDHYWEKWRNLLHRGSLRDI